MSVECGLAIAFLLALLLLCSAFFCSVWCALDRSNRAHTEPTPAQVERASLLQLKGSATV